MDGVEETSDMKSAVVLSESDYGHQALSDIIPLRDLFGLLFFVSVGMLLDPMFLVDHFAQIVVLVCLVSLGKGLMFYSLSRLFGYSNIVPLAVGLGLFWALILAWRVRVERHNPGASRIAGDILAGGILLLFTIAFFWRTISGDVFQRLNGVIIRVAADVGIELHEGESELFGIVGGFSEVAFFLHLDHLRSRKAGKCCDDDDNDEQFHQGETTTDF